MFKGMREALQMLKGEKLITSLFLALLASTIIDVVTTQAGLELGGAETNPFVLSFLNTYGFAAWAIGRVVLVLVLEAILLYACRFSFYQGGSIFRRVKKWTIAVTSFLNICAWVVVGSNFCVIHALLWWRV